MRKVMLAFSTVQKYRVRSMCGLDIDPGVHPAFRVICYCVRFSFEI
jgi:hypothetical protein